MSRSQVILLILSVCGGCGNDASDAQRPSATPLEDAQSSQKGSRIKQDAAEPYDWSADAGLLRRTYDVSRKGDPPLMASSGEATSAAYRIFTHVDFEGFTREQVLEILGDPRTLSDYTTDAGDGSSNPLVYRFDTGWDSTEYRLHFDGDRVRSVEALSGD